jgi:chromosome segregation ATPase
MESGVTVRFKEINTDVQQPATSSATHVGGDPLSAFLQESEKANERSNDGGALHTVNDRGIISRVKRSLGTLSLVRDLAETIDSRFATLKRLDQASQDRADALESLNQRILDGTGHADYVARLFRSLDPRLAALKEREQGLRAVETAIAAFQDRVKTVISYLERHVDAGERREALVGQTVEQLGRRAADTINDLESRVDDCEARARTANETIAHLHDVSTRALPELQQRLTEADEKNDLVDQRIAEAARLASSLTDLEQRLPEVARCDQELARIELVVPQVERQLADLDAIVGQQIRALTVHQQRTGQTHDEAQKIDAIVSGLENRLADLSQSDQRLEAVALHLGQLEQRAAAAATEFEQTGHARNNLEQQVVVLQNQLRRITETAESETKRLVEVTQQADRDQYEHAQRVSLVLSGIDTRMADVQSGHQLLDEVEQQLRQLEIRAAAATADLKQASRIKTDLDLEVVELQNQLQRLTATTEDGTRRLVEINQRADRDLRERAQRASAVLSALEGRMADVEGGHRLFDQLEQQLEHLEARSVVATAEVKQTTGATSDLEQHVVELGNQLRRTTEAADEEARKLVDLTQQAERHRHEQAQSASAVLSGLETGIADVVRSHQQLDAVEAHVGRLELRAAAAASQVERATHAKSALQHEISELHAELRRLTKAARDEAQDVTDLRLRAQRRGLYGASHTDVDDRSLSPQLAPHAWRTRRSLSPERLLVGGVAAALTVTVLVLLGSLWRFNQNGKAANPPRRLLQASRTLTLEPIVAVSPLTPFLINRSSPFSIRRILDKASGNKTVDVPKRSVGTGGTLPQFIGTLVIDSEPAGATAFLNQRTVGKTPVVLKALRVGSYAVRVEYEGYQRWSTAVSVSTIRQTHVTATLQHDISR